MTTDLLSAVQGTATLRNEETGVEMEGSFDMTFSVELRCAPTFRFYPRSADPLQLFSFSRELRQTDSACTVVGAITTSEQPVRVDRVHSVSAHASTYPNEQNFLDFKAEDVTVGEGETATEIKFYVPNLEFWGTEWSILPNNVRRADKSTVQFEDYSIEIRQVPNYQDVISVLRTEQKQVAITSIITLRPKETPLDVASIIELMDILNELLNLAMGKFVFWPKCEGYQEGRLLWQKLRSQRLHPFGPRLGFVDFRSNPRSLQQFVDASLDGFVEWFTRDRTVAGSILQSYLWGLNLPLRETQIYSLSYALEVLIDQFLDHNEKTYHIQNSRKELLDKFRGFVAKEVVPKITDKEKAGEFTGSKLEGRISNFFRRSFRDLIEELLKKSQKEHYQDTWNEWIRDFVKARNCIVHHSDEKSAEELFWAWCKGIELIELIFLGNGWVSTEHHQSKLAQFQSQP